MTQKLPKHCQSCLYRLLPWLNGPQKSSNCSRRNWPPCRMCVTCMITLYLLLSLAFIYWFTRRRTFNHFLSKCLRRILNVILTFSNNYKENQIWILSPFEEETLLDTGIIKNNLIHFFSRPKFTLRPWPKKRRTWFPHTPAH